MSDLELKTRFGPVDTIKWQLLRGHSIIVAWPEWKEVTIDHNDLAWIDWGGAVTLTRDTDDPNWHYRPFLDKNIGKFGKDWMWRVRGCIFNPTYRQHPWGPSTLEIKLRKRNAKWATILQLKWSDR